MDLVCVVITLLSVETIAFAHRPSGLVAVMPLDVAETGISGSILLALIYLKKQTCSVEVSTKIFRHDRSGSNLRILQL